MQTLLFILGIVFVTISVMIGISILVLYLKYSRECKRHKNLTEVECEFYVKFVTIGWRIKTDEAEEQSAVLLTEKTFSPL